MTSDLRERDPELENIRASSLLAQRIRSCINEGYSQGFHGLPAEEVPEGSERVPTTEVSRQRVSSWIVL